MGLFSSSYKTVVGTSISSFNEEANYFKIPTKSLISANAGNGNFSDNLLLNVFTGSFYSSKSAHNYAGRNYVFGRPAHTLYLKSTTANSAANAFNTYLTNTLGATEIFYTKYGKYNYFHELYKLLDIDEDLNFGTGLLGNLSTLLGVDVYIHSTTLLINPDLEFVDIDSIKPITFYPAFARSTEDVTAVGAEMVYRYETIENTGPFTDTTYGTPSVTSNTISINDGPTDYFTTNTVNIGYSYAGPTVSNYTEAASLPDFYQDTDVEKTSNFTYYTQETTNITYVASLQERTTEVISTPVTEEEYTLEKTFYNQATKVLSTDLVVLEAQDGEDYLMSAYEAAGNLVFIEYRIGSGNAAIDSILNQPYTTPGSYLPRLYLRWNAARPDLDKTSITYRDGKRMFKKLGMKYDDVIDAVHLVDGDRTQSDLDEINSALLMWAAEADSTDLTELQYLFHHFEYWFDNVYGDTLDISVDDFLDNVTLDDLSEGVLVIQDTRFKLTSGMQGLWKRTNTGVIGEVGMYDSIVGMVEIPYTVILSGESGDEEFTYNTPYIYHRYRHQFSVDTYIEYLVIGLETKYFVIDGYSTASGYTQDVEDPRDILYVPVNIEVLKKLPLFVRDEFSYKSMRIVANSVTVVKVKWYQRNGWITVFKIIAIVALFYGVTAGVTAVGAAATAAGATIWTVIELILTQIILPAIQRAIYARIFVELAGEEIAFLVAIVASLYAYGSGEFDLSLPYAKEMAAYSSAVYTAVAQSYQREFKEIQLEFEKLEQLKQTELDPMQEELDSFKPKNQVMRDWIRNETPTQFFTRTIGMGNIGPSVYDLQRNSVKLALTLPKTSV